MNGYPVGVTDCTEYHAGMVIMRKTALVIRLQTPLMNMCTYILVCGSHAVPQDSFPLAKKST